MNLIDLYPDIYSNPAKWYGKRSDFQNDEELTEMTVTAVNSGSASVIDTAATGNYGVCVVTGAATTDDSGANIQDDAFTFSFAANRTTLFSAKFQAADITQCDIAAGLIVSDTSIVAGTTTGIFFRKDDGDANLDFFAETNDVTVVEAAAIKALSNATDYTVTFVFIGGTTAGSGTLYVYVNEVLLVEGVTSTNWPSSATYALARSFAFQSGNNSGTHTCNLDFIEAWQSREQVN